MSNQSIDDVIETSHQYHPATKWAKVGTVIEGEVLEAWMQAKRKYGSTEVDTWDDGEPKMQLIVNWVVDGEKQTAYTKPTLQRAVFDAVKASGGRLSGGGRLWTKRVADEPSSTKGYAPKQCYEAAFTPHDSDVDDSLDDV